MEALESRLAARLKGDKPLHPSSNTTFAPIELPFFPTPTAPSKQTPSISSSPVHLHRSSES